MSKQINVNPGQYKVAGRTRQGEDVVHDRERRRLREVEESEEKQRQLAARARRPRGRRRKATKEHERV